MSCKPLRALSRPLEATSLVPRPLRIALEATRSHREDVLSTLEAAGRPPRATRSCWERSPRGLQAREYSRKLRSEPVGPREHGCSRSLWSVEIAAPRASGASRWLLPEPLEPRDSCSQSLWSLEIAAPRASGASHNCSQSLWILMAAASRKQSRRRSKKLRSSSKAPSSRALCD